MQGIILLLNSSLDQVITRWHSMVMSADEVFNLRNKLEMSQDDLSHSFGISGPNTVSRWERGQRRPNETIRRLVCWLNDRPKKEALEFIRELGQYKLKKR
jgi:DNA-binding transcriptional regulator YiaG